MNIGIDAKVLGRTRAGTARYTWQILEMLQELDKNNRYFLFEKGPSGFNLKNPLWKKISLNSPLPGTLWFMLSIPFCIRKYRIDIFWAPENIMPLFFTPKNLRLVLTVHDLAFLHFPASIEFWNYVITKLLQKRSIRKSDFILAVSEFTKRDIIKNYSPDIKQDKIKIVYNGIPKWDTPNEYNPMKRSTQLLFVGSMEPRKNIISLLRALVVIRERSEQVALRIAGPQGWKNRKEHNFIEQNGLSDTVTITGYLSEEELLDEYLSCHALVYPSVYEGFGLPVLEALRTDTLVLTSRGTVMEEIGGKSVILFDPLNPEDIADKIMETYKTSFRRDDYLSEKDEVLGRYSWQSSAEKILEVFESQNNQQNRTIRK